jgi:predicted ATP-dependent endonuclease of OLD family
MEALTKAIAALEKNNELAFSADTEFDKISTLPDQRAAYSYISGQIERLKEQLSTPQRRYQAYLERLKEWTAKRVAIVGSEESPKPETLNWLIQNLNYINENVAAMLDEKTLARAETVKKIFESKQNVLKFYNDLKASVEGRLQSVRADGFEIEIDASFIIDRDFRRQFLHHVNQRKRGPFRNDQDAQQELSKAVQATDWNLYEAVIAFCDGILHKMKNHSGEQMSVAEQANDVKELYDYLFSLDYLDARYELRLGGKNLNELSPGEKGLLLLIFYLQLDRNNTPLVIDQPEDNLDNDSIFAVLAKCIRDAKKHRQVILVTHNPNLAVGADAEQIVYVKLEKPQNYKFSYESGSIENPELNRRIVDVLEGSQPAFVKRRLKYGIR